MNRIKLLFVFLLIVSLNSYAQKFRGGILAGFNASQVDGDTYSGYNKFGLAFGAYTSTDITDKISFELQIRFMQKGARKKVTNLDPSIYISRLNYIEIPVLIGFKINERISFNIGPGFGYLFNYSEEDEDGKLTSAEAISFKAFELSGIGGIRYKINKPFAINLGYSYSILPIANHPSNQTYYLNRGSYNNLFTTVLSYQF
jgi:opacity protein-like surface antigen